MRQADRFGQAVGHQCAGRDDGLHAAAFDHVADNASLFGDGHRAGKRHHDHAVGIAKHVQHDLEGLSQLPSGECRPRHAANQIGKGVDLREIEAFERLQAVAASVVEFSVFHC